MRGALQVLELPRVSRTDLALCLLCTRLQRSRTIAGFFRVVSVLGDGAWWLALAALLPALIGRPAWPILAEMAVAAGAGNLIYRRIKTATGCERPYAADRRVALGAAPLDRYSFPSGHTLHAVAISVVAVSHLPDLGPLLLPFCGLVALSRVVLGLHYPTDVVAGALLGATVGAAALAIP